jgi:hypothetical protein
LSIGAQQGAIADDVNEARDPSRLGVDSADGHLAEEAGDLQAVANVGVRVGLGEGLQVVPGRDPLCELAQVIARQEWRQLGLPNEDNLQEFLAGRLAP